MFRFWGGVITILFDSLGVFFRNLTDAGVQFLLFSQLWVSSYKTDEEEEEEEGGGGGGESQGRGGVGTRRSRRRSRFYVFRFVGA